MLNDVMNYYSFIRDFKGAGYFETEHHQQIVKELKVAIKQGQIVALSGIVGCLQVLWITFAGRYK